MNKKHYVYILVAIAALIVGGLACAVPTPKTVPQSPTLTPFVPTEPPSDATHPPPTEAAPMEVTAAPETSPTETTEPSEAATEEPPEPTATPTPPPPPPTKAPEPTTTPEATVAPLDFVAPTSVHSWEDKGGGSYKVVLKVDISGGVPPFTVSHGPTVQGTTDGREFLIEFDWGSCKSAMVQSITVESSDGQTTKKDYFIAVANMPWCATPSP